MFCDVYIILYIHAHFSYFYPYFLPLHKYGLGFHHNVVRCKIIKHTRNKIRLCGSIGQLSWKSIMSPFTPKISLVILLTVCNTIPMMLVWRIWYLIN